MFHVIITGMYCYNMYIIFIVYSFKNGVILPLWGYNKNQARINRENAVLFESVSNVFTADFLGSGVDRFYRKSIKITYFENG